MTNQCPNYICFLCNNSIIVSNDIKGQKRTCTFRPFTLILPPSVKKNSSQMLQLSEKMPIFVPSVETDWQHRGELLSFDPLENLQNSTCTGEKSESCFSCSSIYTALSTVELAHIYTCRCELISFLRTQVLQNLLAKGCEKAHTLCVKWNINN